MRRREFIALLGGAAASWPLAVRAQQPARVREIAVWMARANDTEGQRHAIAFRERLQVLGWTVGRNIRIDYRWVTGDIDEHNRYCAGFPSHRSNHRRSLRDDQFGMFGDKLFCERLKSIRPTLSKPIADANVAALEPSQPFEPRPETCEPRPQIGIILTG